MVDPSNAAPEWQAGSLWWEVLHIWRPVHSRGLFEVVMLARQNLLYSISHAAYKMPPISA